MVIFFMIVLIDVVILLCVDVETEQMQTLAISLAYLIYDLFCCLFDGQNSLANTIHHLVSIVGLTAGLIYQKVLNL